MDIVIQDGDVLGGGWTGCEEVEGAFVGDVICDVMIIAVVGEEAVGMGLLLGFDEEG